VLQKRVIGDRNQIFKPGDCRSNPDLDRRLAFEFATTGTGHRRHRRHLMVLKRITAPTSGPRARAPARPHWTLACRPERRLGAFDTETA